nr:hypothetical protein [Tanacetum cinerariifolium]
MSTQQDIYAAGSENRPSMLNKNNYVSWSYRIIRYARSRPNGKMIVDSIENGPYVRRMLATLGEPDLPVPVPESFHEQTDEELTENDIKQIDADDQAIKTILLGLLEDEKKAKLFNEWEKFTSTDGELIESYYHRFMQLMNDLKRKKHFPKNIAANLKFPNNLQPEWKRHVTIVHQTKNLHEADFTHIYDFLKMNQDENSYNFPTTHYDQSSSSTHSQQSFPINNKYNPQPSLNQNFMQPPMTYLEDINDPTEAMNAALILFAKAFQLTVPTNNNQRTSSNPRNCQIARPVAQNQQGYNAWQNGIANQSGTGNIVVARAEGTGNGNQARCYNYRGLGIQLQAEEFDFMAAASDLDEIEEVNANCILMENLQHASTSGTKLDKAPVYDTDGSAEVQLNDNCYDNEIFNMFTQEEQYTDLLEPISEPQLVPQNDNHVTSVAPSMVQSEGTIETSSAPNEETRAHQETVYCNLVDQVAQVERLQAQLRDLKGKSSDTPSASNALDPLDQKLESKIVELEFQVVNYEREISHLKTTYKNLFDSITSNWAHAKLYNLIYENAKLRAWLFENTSKSMNNTSGISVTPHVNKPKLIAVTPHPKKLHASILSHFEDVSSDMVNASSTGLVHTARTRRPQPKGNSRNARVPSTSKSSEVKKNVTVKDHHRILLLPTNQKTMSSECNNIKISIRNDKSKIVCGTCKQCLVTVNHDACLLSPVNALNSRANNMCANASPSANQKRHRTHVWKPKQVGFKERLTCKPRLPRFSLKWSPSERSFNLKGKLVASKETNYPNDDKACTSNSQEPIRKRNIKILINFVWKFLGTVCFGNDHIAAILGYGDLKWGNITITRVYFVEGLGHNLFLVGQFCDADLEVAFRRNTCFIRDLDGVDLLKGNRSTNRYTINLYDMASASPICLMACTTPTKSWLWHQRLSHLNFDTINELAKNDLVSELPKFKYAKEHLCPSCEQGKSKRASHPPKPVPNSKQRLHLLHIDLCGPIRVASINGKRYVLVIVDDYSQYTWVYFLKTKDETPEEYFDSVGITHETSAAKTPQQNGVVERRNHTLVEAARTMLIFSHAPLFLWAEVIATACYTQNCSIIHQHFNKTPYELIQGRKPNISYLHVFGALCYLKNDHEDISKLGVKGDIGFFIGYSTNFVAYIVYNRRTKKIMETMNVTSKLELTHASSTITPQRPSERDLDILFEPLHNEYLGGRPSEAPRTILATPVLHNLQAPTASMSFQDSAPAPTNSSNTLVSSHYVDEQSQQHAQQQRNLTPSPTVSAVDNVPYAVFEGDLFVNPFTTPSTDSVVSST